MGWLKKLARSSKSYESNSQGRSDTASQTSRDTSRAGTDGTLQERFTYSSLQNSRSFRILRLKRSLKEDNTGGYDDLPLRGSLIESSIDKPPKYSALSYCWGDATLNSTILLDGKPLAITRSCAAALRRVMKGKVEHLIWVDGICINQATDAVAIEERGKQVAMMDEVYSKAERVQVHLGEGDAASDVACEAIRGLFASSTAAIVPSPFQKKGKEKYLKLAAETLEMTPEYPYGKLHGLFRLPWFKRTWVLQEVALAKDVVFYCGNHLLNFTAIVAGSDFTRLPYTGPNAAMSSYWNTYLNRHNMLHAAVRRFEKGESPSTLGLSLTEIIAPPALSLQATKPEDKINGLYGICTKLGFELPVPDYNKSLDVVYTDAARAIIQQDKSLRILEYVEGASGSDLGLPSWVPDFSGSVYNWSPTNPPHLCPSQRVNRAVSGSSEDSYRFQADGRVLKVKGRRLGSINAVGLPWMTDGGSNVLQDAPNNTGQYASSLLECIVTWYDVVQSNRDPADVDTTLSLLGSLLISESEQPLNTIVQYLDRLVYCSKSDDLRHRHLLVRQEDEGSEIFQVGEFIMSKNMQLVMLAIRASMWRNVFRTNNNYLGTGSYSSQVGDLVIVLHGSRAPCVVRPCADGFLYVGQAYVDGIMNGEFWNSGVDIDDEWFSLT